MTEVVVTDELAAAVDQRIRARRWEAQVRGTPPLPSSDWEQAKVEADERKRREREATARAEEQHQREAREEAEAQARREWEENAPAREAAQRELDRLAPELSELVERVRGLRQTARS